MKNGILLILIWGFGLFLSIQALRHMTAVVQHPYPLEYGEGVNLLWSQRAENGRGLYPEIDETALPQLHNPYPPLYPVLSAGLKILGIHAHPFSSGRRLSQLGLLLAASGIFSLIRRRSTRGSAFLGSLLFLLSPMIMRFGPMMRVDSLALGFSLQALNLLDRQKLKSAALLAALAICVKPSFISAAGTVAFMVLRTKDLKKISLTALCGLVPLLFIGLWMSTQPDSTWIQHLVVLQGLPLDPATTFNWFARFAAQHAPLLTLGLFSHSRMDGPLKAVAPLVFIPLLLTVSISGSQENYMMELWALACIFSACALPALRETHPRAILLLLLLQLGLFFPVAPAPVFTRTYGQEIPSGQSMLLTPQKSDLEIGGLLSAELSALPPSVLSADIGILLAAGQDPVYQPFQFEKLSACAKWSPEALHEAIRSSTFSAILLKGLAEDAADPTFRPETQAIIHEVYSLHRVLGPWHLYLRK